MRLYYPRRLQCGHEAEVAYAPSEPTFEGTREPATRDDTSEVTLRCLESDHVEVVSLDNLDFSALDDGECIIHHSGTTARAQLTEGSLVQGPGATMENILSDPYRGARLVPDNVRGHRGPVREYHVNKKIGPGPEHDFVFLPRT